MQIVNDRKDILSGERLPKIDLVRLCLVDGRLSFDPSNNRGGRGCYLKKEKGSLRKAFDKGLLNRALRAKIEESDIVALEELGL